MTNKPDNMEQEKKWRAEAREKLSKLKGGMYTESVFIEMYLAGRRASSVEVGEVDWACGYCAAITCYIKLEGVDKVVKTMWRSSGLKIENLKELGVPEYDIETISSLNNPE